MPVAKTFSACLELESLATPELLDQNSLTYRAIVPLAQLNYEVIENELGF